MGKYPTRADSRVRLRSFKHIISAFSSRLTGLRGSALTIEVLLPRRQLSILL